MNYHPFSPIVRVRKGQYSLRELMVVARMFTARDLQRCRWCSRQTYDPQLLDCGACGTCPF